MAFTRTILEQNVVSALQLRDYEQLFFGTNQEEGYDKPFLEFTSDTVKQILRSDRVTYFHYPQSATTQLLCAVRLIQNGACAGDIPFRSDRICKKQADYRKHIYWGDSRQHNTDFIDKINIDNSTIITTASAYGQFLCIKIGSQVRALQLFKFDDASFAPVNYAFQLGGGIPTLQTTATSVGAFVTVNVNNSAKSFKFFNVPDGVEALEFYGSTLVAAGTANGEFIPITIQNQPFCIPIYDTTVALSSINTEIRRVVHKPEFGETGQFICAWLSAGYPGQPPLWMDRYFIPGQISGANYLFNSPTVYDVKSTLSLDPGVWYKYFHIGNTFNNFLVNSLTGTTSALKLHLDDWSIPNTADLSPYENDCIIADGGDVFTLPSVRGLGTDNALYLSGTRSYGEVVYDDTIAPRDDFTVSFWCRARDWERLPGNHIVSKNFRGGWDFNYNCGFCNPYYAVFNRVGEGIIINQVGDILLQKDLPAPSRPLVTQPDSEEYVWILDSHPSKRRLYRMDFDGTIVTEVAFASGELITSMALSSDETVAVYNSATGMLSGFNGDGEFLSSEYIGVNFLTITFDPSGVPVGSIHNDLCIDNKGRKWEALNTTGIRRTGESTPVTNYTNIAVKNIACDSNDNIWVTYGINEFAIINSDTFVLVTSGTIGDVEDMTINSKGGLSLAREYKNGARVDVGWFIYEDTQKIYKTDHRGRVIDTIDLELYDIGPVQTRFTSYDWNRKFNWLFYNREPQIGVEIYLGTELSPVCGKYTLSVPACSLANDDWHLFSLTKSSSGDIIFYTDSTEAQKINVPDAVVYYDFENSLFLGTNAGKIQALDLELGEIGLYFNGYIDDVRIYDYVLTPWDLWFIHNNKDDYQDLLWNMDAGKQAYLEEVERFFKFKLPGQKSQFFNIRITGLSIDDEEVREVIEGIIKQTIKKAVPAHAMLNQIIWQ